MARFSFSGSRLIPPMVDGFMVLVEGCSRWMVYKLIVSQLSDCAHLPHSTFPFGTARFVPLGNRCPFVVRLLPFCQGDLDLGAPIFQINTRRDNRHAFDADIIP